jgi:hypothetical protein
VTPTRTADPDRPARDAGATDPDPDRYRDADPDADGPDTHEH